MIRAHLAADGVQRLRVVAHHHQQRQQPFDQFIDRLVLIAHGQQSTAHLLIGDCAQPGLQGPVFVCFVQGQRHAEVAVNASGGLARFLGRDALRVRQLHGDVGEMPDPLMAAHQKVNGIFRAGFGRGGNLIQHWFHYRANQATRDCAMKTDQG